MRRGTFKFVFAGAVVAAIAVSATAHPALFFNGNNYAKNSAGSSSTSGPTVLVLPTLSASIGSLASGAPASPASASAAPSTVKPRTVPPTTGAAAALVADLDNGKIFLGKNIAARWPLASVSKLMTAAVASDLLTQGDHISITDSMVAVDPSEKILAVGDSYSFSDLLRVLLLPSNNVAAEALAEFAGRARFIAAMNAKAAVWGMADTYYDDPSGLSAANESTASDLLKLTQHIYKDYPQIFAITRMPQATVTEIVTGKTVELKNINSFAGSPDFIGGKTGYTDQADGNLLSVFSYNGRRVCIIVLGTAGGNRFEDTQRLFDWFRAQ